MADTKITASRSGIRRRAKQVAGGALVAAPLLAWFAVFVPLIGWLQIAAIVAVAALVIGCLMAGMSLLDSARKDRRG